MAPKCKSVILTAIQQTMIYIVAKGEMGCIRLIERQSSRNKATYTMFNGQLKELSRVIYTGLFSSYC